MRLRLEWACPKCRKHGWEEFDDDEHDYGYYRVDHLLAAAHEPTGVPYCLSLDHVLVRLSAVEELLVVRDNYFTDFESRGLYPGAVIPVDTTASVSWTSTVDRHVLSPTYGGAGDRVNEDDYVVFPPPKPLGVEL